MNSFSIIELGFEVRIPFVLAKGNRVSVDNILINSPKLEILTRVDNCKSGIDHLGLGA